MIYEVFSFYDKKENRHTKPYFVPNLDVMLREVKEQISEIPYPEDKQLKHIGYFDIITGTLDRLPEGLSEPIEIITLIDKGESDNA